MRKNMPRQQDWQGLHRSETYIKDLLHLGAPLSRMWYVHQEMPFQGDQNHQFA